ncbi:MAG: DUF1829 domain-containing protein [Acidimicrobiia bacterium]|nr:DUF1829 domain-containing protein [Acidimicrobiia bacterium]
MVELTQTESDRLIATLKRVGGEAPERLVQTIGHLNKQAVEHSVFSWKDVHPSRPDATALAITNDVAGASTSGAEEALTAYEIKTRWSRREDHVSELASA